MNRARLSLGVAGATLVAIALLQLVPYGRTHQNPPIAQNASWDSPQTEDLARRACFDCHSNETRWPWYAAVAPISWRIQTHVDQGRRKLNFSRMDLPQEEAGESAETVRKGTMPPADYVFMHPRARLDWRERQALIEGLVATLGEGKGKGKDEGKHEGGREHERGGH